MSTNNQSSSKLDFGLVLILMLLFISSCVAIYSAQTTGQYNENFLLKQIVWYIAGSGIIAAVIILDSEQWMKITWYVYGIGIALLAFLIVAPESIAPYINGAKSWYKVPGLGSLQPSEFVKVFLILALSRVIVEHHHKHLIKTIQTDLWLLMKLGIVTLVPLLFVMQQPDLGTSLVFMAILLGMIFVSGISWKILTAIFGSALIFIGTIFYFILWQAGYFRKISRGKTISVCQDLFLD